MPHNLIEQTSGSRPHSSEHQSRPVSPPTVELQASYPLSALQQGMLFHTLAEKGAGFYIQQMIICTEVPLDLDLLSRAWEEVAARHAVLRTAFSWEMEERPCQKVYESILPTIEVHDLSGLSSSATEKHIESFLRADRRRGFDLRCPPAWRLTLLRLPAGASDELVWTFHHILLDGRSHTLVIEEVFEIYDALQERRRPTLDEPRPYREFIDWLHEKDDSRSEAYWRSKLQQIDQPFLLMHATGAPPDEEPQQGYDTRRLSAQTTSRLQTFAHQNQLTLNTLVQGAWALLLSRYSGQNDVLFGTTRNCRHWSPHDTQSMIGLFVNTVPFRVRLPARARLLPWLRGLRSQQVELRQHEHSALTQIQEWSSAPQNAALFDTLLVFEKYQLPSQLRRRGGTWAAREVKLLEKTNIFTLAAYAEEELLLTLEFCPQSCRHLPTERTLFHFETLLLNMLAEPNQMLEEIAIVTPEEHQLLLGDWRGTTAAYPDSTCFHRLFEEQVRRTPEAIAIEHQRGKTSYDELNRHANQLARYLIDRGIGSQAKVAVCMDFGLERVAAFLAIIKAGAIYVPYDPESPRDRLAFLLGDSGVEMILTEEKVLDNIPTTQIPTICIENSSAEISARRDTNLEVALHPSDLAYILYTSGSTGDPKGVLTAHRGLCNLIQAQIDTFELSARSRILQLSNAGFDVSVFEILMASSIGATLVIGNWEEMLPGPNLARCMRQREISAVTLTPTVLRALGQVELPALKVLVCCGEDCTADLVDRWAPGCRFFNAYGPTEVTIWSVVEECFPGQPEHPAIGRPIANLEVYVLDQDQNLLPIGIPGELYIGGVGLAQGYLNRPELNRTHFVPNRWSDDPAARLYRTGDLVRFSPDGRLEFLGRVDSQVKIRGVRIELGEIESILCQHPAVEEAVVVLDKQEVLTGLISAPSIPPSTDELVCFLQSKLPTFLIPRHFADFQEWPRTPSGKVDRRAVARECKSRSAEAPQRAPASSKAPSPDELRTILDEWNRTESPFPRHLCVHELIEDQVQKTPAGTALVQGDLSLPYAELDRCASQLAARLMRSGLELEEPIAVFMERSVEAVIAFYAVLKAGGSFVPIDPTSPRERIAYIVGDCGAKLVLAQPHLTEKLEGIGGTLVPVDYHAWTFSEDVTTSPIRPPVAPDQRAYIIYTSGSTGRPKGVEIEHSSLVNLACFYRKRLELRATDRSAMIASVAFDASQADIWPYLTVGAAVSIPPHQVLTDPQRLIQWLDHNQISVVFLPTALAELVLNQHWPQTTALRFLLTGGDRLRGRPISSLAFTLINTYGPTENTVDSTWGVVDPGNDPTPPTIGRPIDNVRAYVVDAHLEPVPVGTAGELLLGGHGLARGYLNRADLTAERFIADPFTSHPDSRLYRTGDLVRYRPNGELEFIGRIDDQVQIRGFRVELGEIEAVLCQHPCVREATVSLVGEPGSASEKLAAHVVASPAVSESETRLESEPAPDSRPTSDSALSRDLRTFLERHLPSYMIPSVFVFMQALPRNINGKIDRKALPVADLDHPPADSTDRQHADSPLERKLVAIWEDVLGVTGIGREDNFFHLGGHSLLVLPLLARIKAELGVQLSIANLMQRPTIAQLVRSLQQHHDRHRTSACIIEIQPHGDRRPIFCAAGVGGGTHWFRGFAQHLSPHQPLYGLELLGLSQATTAAASIEAMASEFIAALRSFQPKGPYRLGGYSVGGIIAFEMAQQLQRAGDDVELLFLIETYWSQVPVGSPRWIRRYLSNFWRLDRRAKVRFFRDKIIWIGELIRNWLITRNTKEEHLELIRAMHSHMEAETNYVPSPYPGRLVLLRAQRPPNSAPLEPHAGWGAYCPDIRVHVIPGDHYSMFQSPSDRSIAAALEPYVNIEDRPR